MWPHKKGLGNRLSYGVYGNAIVSIDSVIEAQNQDQLANTNITIPHNDFEMSKKSIPMMFPRLNDETVELTPKQNSNQKLVENQISKFNINSSMANTINSPINPPKGKLPKELSNNTYIPQDIIRAYMFESKSLTSNMAYDPIHGDLLQTFDIFVKSEDAYVDLMTFVTGESLSILNITTYESKDDCIVLSPAYQIDFCDPILQIEVSDKIDGVGLVAVRTGAKVYILNICLDKLTYIEVIPNVVLFVLGEISADCLAGNVLADVRFSSNDSRKVAVVDIKGNLTVWYVNKTVPSIRKFIKEQFVKELSDSQSLSNWRRICWLPLCDHLLIISRVEILKVMPNSESSGKIIVTSNTWSRIRDVNVVDEYMFLLTSKELIWFSANDSMTRLLSWKHFLDDSDPSLKFKVVETSPKVFTCFLYSQVNPLVIVYSFGFKGNKPYSLRDPYYFRKSSDNYDLRQINITKTEDALLIFELTTGLAIHLRRLISKNENDISNSLFHSKLVDSSVNKHRTNYLKQFSKKEIKKMIPQFSNIGEHDCTTASQQIDLIQRYAYELGNGFAQMGNSQAAQQLNYFSLYEVCNSVPLGVTDLLELDDMIVQLENSLPPERLKVKSLINNSFIRRNKFINKKETNTHIYDIYQMLEQIYPTHNKPSSKLAASILIGLSLIKCQYESNDLKEKLQKSIANAPEKVQTLLNEWDEEDNNDNSQTEGLTPTQHDSQFMIPTIKSSIPALRVNSQPSLRQQVLTQNSQTQTLLPSSLNSTVPSISSFPSQRSISSQGSQSKSGSQPKKKRKKKGGFA